MISKAMKAFCWAASLALLVGGTAVAWPAADSSVVHGTVVHIKVHGKSLEGNLEGDSPDRDVSVYLPPSYKTATNRRYPVVYLLHGQLQDDRIWFDELGAAQIADAAILAGRKPFVIVAPYEEDNFAPVVDSMFGAAVVKDLIPYVEANYRVCTTRECRAIGGISHGAGWAVHIAIMNIDLFGSVGAHSVGYFIGDSTRIDRLLKTMTAQDFPRFYVDRGDRDYLADEIDALHRTLARNGIDHTYIVQAGSHSVSYWSAHIAEYLQWYMDGWDPPA